MADSVNTPVAESLHPQTQGSAWTPLGEPLFRSLWLAAVISYIGTWMQNVGAGWLMTQLTTSPLMVSLVTAATTLPVFLVILPAGALADMVDRRRFLLATQLAHIDYLDQIIEQVSAEVAQQLAPFASLIERLDAIPGIARRTAEIVLEKNEIKLSAEDQFKLKAVAEIIMGKLAKRQISLKNVEKGEPDVSPLGHAVAAPTAAPLPARRENRDSYRALSYQSGLVRNSAALWSRRPAPPER